MCCCCSAKVPRICTAFTREEDVVPIGSLQLDMRFARVSTTENPVTKVTVASPSQVREIAVCEEQAGLLAGLRTIGAVVKIDEGEVLQQAGKGRCEPELGAGGVLDHDSNAGECGDDEEICNPASHLVACQNFDVVSTA